MEKRALIAIALSFLVLVLWTRFFAPKPPPRGPEEPAVAESQTLPQEEAGAPAPSEAPETTLREVEPSEEETTVVAAPAVEEIRVETEHYDVLLTNEGGRALSWKLRDYTAGNSGEPLDLVPRFEDTPRLPLSTRLDDPELTEDLNQALFEVHRETIAATDDRGAGQRVEFAWSDGRGLSARKALTFWARDWLVDVELDVTYRGRRQPARLAVGPGFAAQESRTGKSSYYYSSQGLWNLDGRVTREKRKALVEADGSVSGRLLWAGLDDQYFAALILPGTDRAEVKWHSVEVKPLPLPDVSDANQKLEPLREPVLSVSVGESGAKLFFGPKNYRLLHGMGSDLESAVWFATNPFLAWVSRQIFLGLLWIHDHVAPNYGLAIILATFVLRLLLFPVNQYSMVSMKKAQLQMARLQPKIKAIRAKYKKAKDAQSRAKMNQETMELYKREGVNPMGGVTGCLPLLAQFPVLIGFYNMLTVAIELRGASFFGWIQDLSQKDPYWIIPILMGVTMFVQQKMAMSKVTDPMQAQQQKFMMFMPILFTYICLQMPSGMVLYWFVNNLLGIGQQWLVNRHTGRLEAAAQKA